MESLFYISALIAVLATVMVITRRGAMHALLYLVVALLAVALVFYSLGAAFAAAMQAIIYAGAVMVLLVFLVMLTDLSPDSARQEKRWLRGGVWFLPLLLGGLMLVLLLRSLWSGHGAGAEASADVGPQEVGGALMSWQGYALALELASMLLLSALVGVIHLLKNPHTFSREPQASAAADEGRGAKGEERNDKETSSRPAPHTPRSTNSEGAP